MSLTIALTSSARSRFARYAAICQIVVQRAEGSVVYSGRFAKQLKL